LGQRARWPVAADSGGRHRGHAGKTAEYLREEVARSLKGVSPADRKRFLEASLARFPVAGRSRSPRLPPCPSPRPFSSMKPGESGGTISGGGGETFRGKTRELAKRLSEAGLAWVDRSALVLEISDELRQKLGSRPTSSRV